jgi:hypothetical protein
LKTGSTGLKALAQGHIKESQDLVLDCIFEPQKIDSFFNNYYSSIEKIIKNSSEEIEQEKTSKYLESLDTLSQGHFIPNETLIELSEILIKIFTILLGQVTEFEEKMRQLFIKVEESLEIFKLFDGQFTDLKSSLQASTDSDVFYKTLYSNYNTEMNFVIKNYFLFFDIIQKTTRKIFKASVDGDLDSVNKRIVAKLAKIDSKKLEIVSQINSLQDLHQEATKTVDQGSNVFFSLATTIKDLDKELKNMIVTCLQELEVFIHEPIQLLHRSLKALDKVFKEVSEHSDIEDSFLSVIDESEATMLDTIKADHSIKPLLDKKIDISSKNQLVFTSDFDLQKYYAAYKSIHNGWTKDVGHYLKPDGMLNNPFTDKSKDGKSHDKSIPAEVDYYLELSEEDKRIANTLRFDARVNRKNIPHNGVILMMSDYFVFYSSSVAGTINLLIPYDSIIELKPKKNFIGQNNGVNVELKKGSIEFYLASSSKRDEFSGKAVEFREVNGRGLASPIRAFVEPRAFALGFDQSTDRLHREEATTDHAEPMADRAQRCLKKLVLGTFDHEAPLPERRLLGCGFNSVVELVFGIKPYIFDGKPKTNFLYHWREESGCSGIEICTLGQLPTYLCRPEPDFDEFLNSPLTSTTLTLYETHNRNKVKEKISLVFTHPDQLAVVISVTTGQKLEFECLMLIRQEGGSPSNPFSDEMEGPEASVVVKVWPKRGLKGSLEFLELYSQRLVDFIVLVGEQKANADRHQDSRFSPMV